MKIVELILDEEQEYAGIEAISIVEKPAIEEDFITLNKDIEYKLAEVDDEKRILLGALLIPNKPILRKGDDEDYYIYFSKDTVRKASELYLMEGNQNNATLEHQMQLKGLSLVESWIVEDSDKDKTAVYGLKYPVGTWVGSVKVTSDKVWQEFVKTGAVKGFSIEGYFQNKEKKDALSSIEMKEAEYILSEIKDVITGVQVTLESYSDYPQSVKNNAKRGIELNKKINNRCATDVGKIRAQQLAKGEKISVDTIKRMYSFLSRAETYYDPNDTKSCGTISYLLWGGLSAKNWARGKMNELNLYSEKVNDDLAIIDDRLAYSSQEKAEEMAKSLGCKGFHTHEFEDQVWYMPCEKHTIEDTDLKKPCWDGYEQRGMKMKNGRKVPNCVKMTEERLAEIGPRGGIRRSKKAPKSSTPNRNPKGKGTAKGDAKTSRGAKVDKTTEGTLQKKSDEFNERYKKKLGYGVTIGQLKTVFQRGLGAFNVSHSPRVTSAKQWALARVAAYLYLVRTGRPENAKYVGDNDLLPKGHPKSDK
jgi:DNA-binding transcriptional regulator YhcF (GntR family)